jgi:hypothetical protein
VGHHFDWSVDGHKRKYHLHVQVNASASASAALAAGARGGGAAAVARSPLVPMGSHPNNGKVVEVYLTRAGKVDGLAMNNKIPYVTKSFQREKRKMIEKRKTVALQRARWRARRHCPLALTRARSSLPPPSLPASRLTRYVTINSLTLIAALRLGLVSSQRSEAYQAFLSMPLYEDMTPWNIAFRGSSVHYIDYDTRDKTFDAEVAAIYQSLSVLMNYKRASRSPRCLSPRVLSRAPEGLRTLALHPPSLSCVRTHPPSLPLPPTPSPPRALSFLAGTVQDFKKCGHKGKNGPYNFPFMSECIGSDFSGPCPEPAAPVPCGNGECTTDYIACLKSMTKSEMERRLKEGAVKTHAKPTQHDAADEKERLAAMLDEGALDLGTIAFE